MDTVYPIKNNFPQKRNSSRNPNRWHRSVPLAGHSHLYSYPLCIPPTSLYQTPGKGHEWRISFLNRRYAGLCTISQGKKYPMGTDTHLSLWKLAQVVLAFLAPHFIHTRGTTFPPGHFRLVTWPPLSPCDTLRLTFIAVLQILMQEYKVGQRLSGPAARNTTSNFLQLTYFSMVYRDSCVADDYIHFS